MEKEKLAKYSYDWWYELGASDAKKKWDNTEFWNPKYPKVKPYMHGWIDEDEGDRKGGGMEYDAGY